MYRYPIICKQGSDVDTASVCFQMGILLVHIHVTYYCFHLIQVKDNDRVQVLGSLSIPVSRLLSCQDLNLDEWFNLENSGPESRIHINTVLRVNSSDTRYASLSTQNTSYCIQTTIKIQ